MPRRKTGVEPKDEVELTEITKAEIVRVDGVLGPANGTPTLLMKSLPDDGKGAEVAEALAKAAPEDDDAPDKSKPPPRVPSVPAVGDQVDGPDAETPGKEPVEKAEMSGKAINDLPDSAFAHIEPGGKKDEEGKTTPRSLRHFPVHDEAHARNALSRAPQSPFGEKAMPKIRAAARKFGVEVSKAEGEEMPGSAAWEAQDAAALRSAASQLADLRNRVATARDREAAEDEPYDWENASDLDCAVQAIECALGIIARISFTEQVEAMKPDGDDIQKAGRMLSAKNAQSIRDAMDRLTELLSRNDQRPENERPMPDAEGGTNEVTKAELDAVLDRVTGGFDALAKALQAATVHEPQSTPPPAGSDMSAGFGSEGSIEAQQDSGLPGQDHPPQSPPEPGRETPDGDDPEDSSGATMKEGISTIEGDVARQERFAGAPAGTPPKTPGDMSVTKAAAETHGAFTGTHSHPHDDSDGEGTHSHEHTHDGDGDHDHAHRAAKSAPADTEALIKSLLEPVMKSVQEAVTAATVPLETRLEAVAKQVADIAATPLPGGPMLQGGPQMQDYHLRRHAQTQTQALPTGDEAELRKALEGVKDPQARDALGRALALQSMSGVFPQR